MFTAKLYNFISNLDKVNQHLQNEQMDTIEEGRIEEIKKGIEDLTEPSKRVTDEGEILTLEQELKSKIPGEVFYLLNHLFNAKNNIDRIIESFPIDYLKKTQNFNQTNKFLRKYYNLKDEGINDTNIINYFFDDKQAKKVNNYEDFIENYILLRKKTKEVINIKEEKKEEFLKNYTTENKYELIKQHIENSRKIGYHFRRRKDFEYNRIPTANPNFIHQPINLNEDIDKNDPLFHFKTFINFSFFIHQQDFISNIQVYGRTSAQGSIDAGALKRELFLEACNGLYSDASHNIDTLFIKRSDGYLIFNENSSIYGTEEYFFHLKSFGIMVAFGIVNGIPLLIKLHPSIIIGLLLFDTNETSSKFIEDIEDRSLPHAFDYDNVKQDLEQQEKRINKPQFYTIIEPDYEGQNLIETTQNVSKVTPQLIKIKKREKDYSKFFGSRLKGIDLDYDYKIVTELIFRLSPGLIRDKEIQDILNKKYKFLCYYNDNFDCGKILKEYAKQSEFSVIENIFYAEKAFDRITDLSNIVDKYQESLGNDNFTKLRSRIEEINEIKNDINDGSYFPNSWEREETITDLRILLTLEGLDPKEEAIIKSITEPWDKILNNIELDKIIRLRLFYSLFYKYYDNFHYINSGISKNFSSLFYDALSLADFNFLVEGGELPDIETFLNSLSIKGNAISDRFTNDKLLAILKEEIRKIHDMEEEDNKRGGKYLELINIFSWAKPRLLPTEKIQFDFKATTFNQGMPFFHACFGYADIPKKDTEEEYREMFATFFSYNLIFGQLKYGSFQGEKKYLKLKDYII